MFTIALGMPPSHFKYNYLLYNNCSFQFAKSELQNYISNSKDTNTRGRLVAELITQNKLNIENKGAVATFLNTRGFNSIIDLTLTNDLSTTMI